MHLYTYIQTNKQKDRQTDKHSRTKTYVCFVNR